MKNLIPKSFIQEVVSRTDIVTLIGSRIELKKRGHTHTACCPFHTEKTPSFSVSQSKQFYYCFGCGAHGNAIGFLMAYDHLSFVDSITDLANQLGMTVPLEKNDSDFAGHDELYTLLHHAQTQYENALKKSDVAITYLKSRGLTGKIAKMFGVGYAPSAWEFLSKQFPQKKEALVLSGMAIKREDRPQSADHRSQIYDRFRNRIMFPIRDVRGRTIGFGGRTLTDETPKYLNSPETPVFHKNQTLYGLYEMCQHHRKLERALIVEGYLDVIGLAQHDIHYAVATLGTAFNVKHTQLLLRYTNDIVFCFDGDNAGKKAAWKALTLSLPLLRDGINLRVLFLPANEDPDSLIQKIGKNAFEKLIDEAAPLSDVFFDALEKEFSLNTIAGKAGFAKMANDHINTMPPGIYKNLLLNELANRLHIARADLAELSIQPEEPVTPVNTIAPPKKTRTHLNPVQTAIQLLLQHPPLAALATQIPAFAFSEKTAEKMLLIDLIERYKTHPHLHIGELLEMIEDETERSMITKIASLPLHIPEEGYPAEFIGALQRLHEKDQAHQLSRLVAKAKHPGLNDEEKQLLQLLLAKKHAAKNSNIP